MLKKNGYYCFVHQAENGTLYLLYGGQINKLEYTEIHYYYDNMDKVIAYINKPLFRYTAKQKQIASVIKSIGGTGKIHGAIIDINYYNHIYVNPLDFSVTGYWATDIVNKRVFSSIPQLLETNCPDIFQAYKNLSTGMTSNILAIKNGNSFILPLAVVIDSEDMVRFIRSYSVITTSVEQCFERLGQE